MRIFGFQRYGGPDVLEFLDVPRPRPGKNDVLIDLRAVGINPADIKVRSGARQGAFPVEFPMAVGREAAGIVREAPIDSPFRAGQLVFGGTAAGTGALGEYVLLDASQTAVVPRGLSAAEAACIPVAFGTAWDALHELNLSRGDSVLVLGAGGGVGAAALQFARVLGLKAVGVASSSKKEMVEGYGATHIPYDTDGWLEELQAQAEPLPGIVDAAGGETLEACANLVPKGQIRSAADPALAQKLGGSGITRRRERTVYEEIAKLMADKKITVPLTGTYGFDEAAEAVAAVETGHSSGKTVVTYVGKHV